MYIKNRMTSDPYTLEKGASITDAISLMHEKNLRRIPVVENGKAVGIITKSDIQSVSPTKATSLSIYEMNYILTKTSVGDAMTKDPITIKPESLLEEAAVLMRKNRISGLIVVDDDNNVVGIITESDIFDAFIDMFGMNEKGTRMSIIVDDRIGVLADVAAYFKNHNAALTNVVVFNNPGEKAELVFRTSSVDTEDIQNDLTAAGYKVASAIITK